MLAHSESTFGPVQANGKRKEKRYIILFLTDHSALPRHKLVELDLGRACWILFIFFAVVNGKHHYLTLARRSRYDCPFRLPSIAFVTSGIGCVVLSTVIELPL